MKWLAYLIAILLSTQVFAGTFVQFFQWTGPGSYKGHRQPFSHVVLIGPLQDPSRPAEVHLLVKGSQDPVCIFTADSLKASGLLIGDLLSLLNNGSRNLNISCSTSNPSERYARIESLSIDSEGGESFSKTW